MNSDSSEQKLGSYKVIPGRIVYPHAENKRIDQLWVVIQLRGHPLEKNGEKPIQGQHGS